MKKRAVTGVGCSAWSARSLKKDSKVFILFLSHCFTALSGEGVGCIYC